MSTLQYIIILLAFFFAPSVCAEIIDITPGGVIGTKPVILGALGCSGLMESDT